ncbi:hypothetical protein [Pseudomonas sp. Irchel 3F5]|uniref:hypothetical protein n=1 Tax=Pseudomonas sp. Irchel 3F5 TaxID=2009002 RepID=UPI00113FFA52|nr:hypothetical protein [Pseudomonas sp. Irchel 3F5]
MNKKLTSKPEALARWNGSLRNEHLRLSNPEVYLQVMRMATADLQAPDLFDPLELHDLCEQAQAAYSAALEEQFARELYYRASSYNVVPVGGHRRIGCIRQGNYYKENRTESFSCDGMVIQEPDRLRVVLRTSGELGVIQGLQLIGADGRVYRLVETARMIEGRMLQGIDDPDAYRVLIDLAQEAFEEKEWARYRLFRDRMRYSPFKCCSACCDSFAQREDCEICQGQGFVADNLGEPGCAED